jgi:hypothetical protein
VRPVLRHLGMIVGAAFGLLMLAIVGAAMLTGISWAAVAVIAVIVVIGLAINP